MTEDYREFCRMLPKLELHAHLNGSLSLKTLRELGKMSVDSSANAEWPQWDTTLENLSTCFELFSIAHNLTQTVEAIKLSTLRTIEEFAADGVVYLELRSTLRCCEKMDKRGYLQAMIDAVIEAKDNISMIKVCLIVSINRSEPLRNAEDNINIACEYNKLYPHIVVGIDLSGDPSKGNFKDFVDLLTRADSSLKRTIHFAEIHNDEEVMEILKFGPERLGHGTFLSEQNLNLLLRKKIPIEVCVTSNLKCGTVSSVQSHHFIKLRSLNHPLILATDDKGVFETSLSEEYLLATKHFNLKPKDCWTLNYIAIDFIFASQEVKNELKELLCNWRDEHLKYFVNE